LILLACRTPRRFAELMREAGVSRAWLAEAVKKLIEEGLLEKLPDGSYALTEKGRELAEAAEVEVLVGEAVERRVVSALKAEIERLFTVEAAVKVLRAWAMATAAWKWVCQPDAKASDEEKRAVMVLEAYLKLLGGDAWWRRYSLLLPSRVVDRMNDIYEAGRNPIIALAAPKENVPSEAAELLSSVPQRGVEALPEEAKSTLLYLANLAEERVKALKDKSILEKLAAAIQGIALLFSVERKRGDEKASGVVLMLERELEKYLS